MEGIDYFIGIRIWNLSSSFSSTDRRSELYLGKRQDHKAVSGGTRDQRQQVLGARFINVELNQRAGLQVVECQYLAPLA